MKTLAIILLVVCAGCRWPGIDNVPKPQPVREVVSKSLQSQPLIVQKPVTNYLRVAWTNDRPQEIDSWLIESSTNLTGWIIVCVDPRELYYAPETKSFEVFRVQPIDPVTWYQPGHDYPGQIVLNQQQFNDYVSSH